VSDRPAGGLVRALAVVAVLAGLGLAVATVTVAYHRLWWGMALGVATSLAVAVAIRPGVRRVAYAAGWVLGGFLLLGERPEGDVWFTSDARAYVLMGVAFVMVVHALASLPPRARLSSGE
jgi:hypothetical protein